MGQGTEVSAAGAQQGGGAGFGLLSSLFGGGGSNADIAKAAYGVDRTRLADLLQDPQVLQAIGDIGSTAQALGKTIEKGNKIPGPAAQMLQQALDQHNTASQPDTDPYVGDAIKFSPQQAQMLLERMGIGVSGSNGRFSGDIGIPLGSPPPQVPPMPALPPMR